MKGPLWLRLGCGLYSSSHRSKAECYPEFRCRTLVEARRAGITPVASRKGGELNSITDLPVLPPVRVCWVGTGGKLGECGQGGLRLSDVRLRGTDIGGRAPITQGTQ